MSKIAFLFPGQGAQYPGMAKDFYESFATAREVFEEADDILGRNLSKIILTGPEELLTETRNSQVGIYVASYAIYRTLHQLLTGLAPVVCSGLSLGEYTAATVAGKISFQKCLPIVQNRGDFMNDACEETRGTMAVILGLSAEVVEQMVADVNLPNDLWAANFNCPGQVVISGTEKGIEAGTRAAKELGAKRVMPLQVHGAFHSGLMKRAEERLAEVLAVSPIEESDTGLVMNVTGTRVDGAEEIRKNLVHQVTSPVRWEQGMRAMESMGLDLYVEMGCGKTLAGFHKRIGAVAPIKSIEKVEDIRSLEECLL